MASRAPLAQIAAELGDRPLSEVVEQEAGGRVCRHLARDQAGEADGKQALRSVEVVEGPIDKRDQPRAEGAADEAGEDCGASYEPRARGNEERGSRRSTVAAGPCTHSMHALSCRASTRTCGSLRRAPESSPDRLWISRPPAASRLQARLRSSPEATFRSSARKSTTRPGYTRGWYRWTATLLACLTNLKIELAAVTPEHIALGDHLPEYLQPLEQVVEPLSAAEPRARLDVEAESAADEMQGCERADIGSEPPLRGCHRQPCLEENEESDLVSCRAQLVCHLVRDDTTYAGADEI